LAQAPIISPVLIRNRATNLIRQHGHNALLEASNNAANASQDGGPTAIEFHDAVLTEVRRQLGERFKR
jgi:hypothetical protein